MQPDEMKMYRHRANWRQGSRLQFSD